MRKKQVSMGSMNTTADVCVKTQGRPLYGAGATHQKRKTHSIWLSPGEGSISNHVYHCGLVLSPQKAHA